MRKTTLFALIIFTITLTLCLHPSYLYTETSKPSPGNTLAPGEPTCGAVGCHTGNPEILDTSKLTFKSLSPSINSGYQLGQTYNLYVNMGLVQQFKKGFQITAIDQNGNGAGTFSLSSATLTSLSTSGNRQYVGHKNANSNSSWGFRWQAPVADIGPITFYYTGVGANSDNQSTGDFVYRGHAIATTSSFSQLVLTGIKPINADEVQAVKIFPNPFSKKLSVEYFLHDESRVTIELFDLSGRLMRHWDECVDMPGYHQRNFELEEKVNAGLYILKISEGEKIYFKKLVAE